jgi:hypothetical protein
MRKLQLLATDSSYVIRAEAFMRREVEEWPWNAGNRSRNFYKVIHS